MRVLVVEDDVRAGQALVRGLREHGYQVELAEDGLEGLSLARSLDLDGLILDVGLPRLDGFSLLSDLRGAGIQTPVLILTAKDSLEDRLKGLELGGGDYLVKPFSFTELLLRLHNLLRRGPAASGRVYSAHGLELDSLRRKVRVQGQPVDLSNQEFTLLELLLRNEGHVVARSRIAEELWGLSYDRDPNLVEAAVRRLRKRLDDQVQDRYIQTVRGVGYTVKASDG